MATQIRSLWAISETEFPRNGSPREKLMFALTYAMLAPSKYNSQPWRFRLGDNYVDLLAEPTQAYDADPNGREAIIGCGAALLHLRLALAHFGCYGTLDYETDLDEPERLARIYFGSRKAREPWENEAFDAIPRRHTNRSPFLPRMVAPDLTAELKEAAETENAWLDIAESETTRQRVVQMIEESQRNLKEIQTQLSAQWRMEASGFNRVPSVAAPLAVAAIRWLGLDKTSRAHQIQRVEHAPVLAILKTKTDDQRGWLQAGQAMERVLLHGYARGLSASFLNEPVTCAQTRIQLRTAIGRRGFPQIILRLGYAAESPLTPTSRREVMNLLQ